VKLIEPVGLLLRATGNEHGGEDLAKRGIVLAPAFADESRERRSHRLVAPRAPIRPNRETSIEDKA
jgi:hypothetical protein